MDFAGQMISFHALCPDIAAKETRVVTIGDARLGFRPGQYIFFELYCADKKCDCRRAMIQVKDTAGDLYATLSYGWEDLQFYIDWMHGDLVVANDIPGINLYALQPQSEYASKFLDLFRNMMEDQSLAKRYRRHYVQFKAAIGERKARMMPPVDLADQRKHRRRLRRLAQAALHT